MFAISYLIAVAAPYAAGALVQRLFRGRSMRQLLRLPEKEPQEVADKVVRILDRSGDEEMSIGWGVVGVGLLAQIVLATDFFTFVVPALTLVALGASRLLRDGRRLIRESRHRSAVDAVRFHFENSSRQVTEGLMLGLSQTSSGKLRAVGTYALASWGSPWTLQQLGKERESEFTKVRELAREEHNWLERLLHNAKPTRLEDLRKLVSEKVFWKRLATSFQPSRPQLPPPEAMVGKGFDPLEAQFVFQGELLRHFPHVYCSECLTGSEKQEHEEWVYVRCRTCREANDLVPDVREVIGVVGPLPVESHRNGQLYLSLWNEEKQVARAGEINRLVIRSGGAFNYDWAVSATVEALHNRFPDRDLQLGVELDPEIDLQPNTHNLLRSIQP